MYLTRSALIVLLGIALVLLSNVLLTQLAYTI